MSTPLTHGNYEDSNAYYQSLRDRFSLSRTHVLKRFDQMLLRINPLETLQAYACITGSSPQQVLEHFLTVRLESTKATLKIQSSDSLTIVPFIRSVKSTVTDVKALFPFTLQRTLNDIKSLSLLSHGDLRQSLQRRRANIGLWINRDLKRFMIWTKSDVLDAIQVEEMLETWTQEVENLLRDKVGGLFVEIQQLDMLCSLRGEIISILLDSEEDVTLFEERICNVLVNGIARQIKRLMIDRVRNLHDLESMAMDLTVNSKGIRILQQFD